MLQPEEQAINLFNRALKLAIPSEWKEQSKEMEKEQIIDAYDKGEFNQGCNGDAEQYYKETFKKD